MHVAALQWTSYLIVKYYRSNLFKIGNKLRMSIITLSAHYNIGGSKQCNKIKKNKKLMIRKKKYNSHYMPTI